MDLKPSTSFSRNETMRAEHPLSDAFHFEVPSWISAAGEEYDGQTIGVDICLPSSLCVRCNSTSASTRSCWVGGCTIAYRIKAVAAAGGVTVAETTRTISIVPTLKAAPPVSTEGFLGEYVKSCMVKLRTSVLQRPLGTLSLRATEPSPLTFSHGKGLASSNMNLQLCFQRNFSFDRRDPPPLAQIHVRVRLDAITIVSVVAQKKQPTEQEANISPFSKRKVEECSREALWTLLCSPWRPQRLVSSSGEDIKCPNDVKLTYELWQRRDVQLAGKLMPVLWSAMMERICFHPRFSIHYYLDDTKSRQPHE